MQQSYWNRKLTRRRALQGVAAVGGAGVALGACGGSESKPAQEPASQPSLSEPKRGGTLRSWVNSPPDNPGFDTYLNWSGPMAQFASFIYPKLTRFKAARDVGPLEFIVEPDLARSIEQPEQLTYVFKIHENARWQDLAPTNGRRLTAEDVKWNIDLWHEKGQNRALTAPWVDKVEAVDDVTVRFRLKRPLAAFMSYIGHTGGPFIMPRELKENDQSREKTAAAGAFILDRYETGSAVIYKRNPGYFKAPSPYVDGVTLTVIADPSTIGANLRTGALDLGINTWVPQSLVSALRPVLTDGYWLKATNSSATGWCSDLLDTKNGLRDERVRQALSVALDRDKFFLFRDQPDGYAWHTPLPTYKPWWLDPKKDAQMLPYYKRDVQKSKQLLSAAGFPNGLEELPYLYQVNATANDEAAFHQSSLREAGVNLKLEPAQGAEWFQKGQGGNAPGHFYAGANHFNTDPDEGLTLLLDPNSPRSPVTNRQVLAGDAKLLDLMDKIKFELDHNRRKGYVDEVQRHLAQKMYIIGGLEDPRYYYAAKRVKNMNWVVQLSYGGQLDNVWIDEG